MNIPLETLWQEFLTIVREESGSRVVDTWFKAVHLLRWEPQERSLYLEAPNPFVRQWITTHYLELIKTNFKRLLNEEQINVVFTNQNSHEQLAETPAFQPARVVHESTFEPVIAAPPVPMPTAVAPLPKHDRKARPSLISHYRFDTFVVGPSNSLAYSAAQAAAENIGRLYNPLFIYGGSGLGKTHLLHAIGNYVKEKHKKASVLYQPTDRFVQEFVAAIRLNKVIEFEARFRDVDVLLVDDIQFISKKEQTQEAFFRIFNQLHQEGRQIVLMCDAMPCDICGLAERVRSRLEGGLIADIQMPTLETKIAILYKKAETHNYVLDDDVAYFIASCECSSIRELEGMLIRVVANASLAKQPVTVGLARKVLAQSIEAKKENYSIADIAKSVSRHFNYSIKDLRSNKRNKELVHARHITMYLMKQLTETSLREISAFFARKDHTTVLSALNKIERRCKRDRNFIEELKAIERDFRGQEN